MITKERLSIFEKQFGQAVADKHIATFGDAAKYGLDWMYNAMQSDVQKGSELIVRWMKAWQAEKDDNSALTAENAQLRAALQSLIDEQNDAPLEKRRTQWKEAMNEARAILSK